MKLFGLSDYIAAHYEALFLRQLKLENGKDGGIAHGKRTLRQRFSVAGAIFPTEATWPRYQY